MRYLFCLLMVASQSACAGFGADAGKFGINGVSANPEKMAKTLGDVRRRQYQTETSRLYVEEAMKRGRPVSPTVIDSLQVSNSGYGAYPGYMSGGERWFYGYDYPSVLNGTYMPDQPSLGVSGPSDGAGYATKEELAAADKKATAALRTVKALVEKKAEEESASQK